MALVSVRTAEPNYFQEFEKTLLEVCNDIGRQAVQEKLNEYSQRYESEYLSVDGIRYKRHTKGTVEYHSQYGSVSVTRFTYREAGVRNGPTIVPLELSEQLVERTHPHWHTESHSEMLNAREGNGKNNCTRVIGDHQRAARSNG